MEDIKHPDIKLMPHTHVHTVLHKRLYSHTCKYEYTHNLFLKKEKKYVIRPEHGGNRLIYLF